MGTLKVNGGLEVNSGIFKVGPLNRVNGSGLFPAFINDDSNQGLAYIMAADMSVGQASNADTLDGYHHSSFLKLSGGTMTGPITLHTTGFYTPNKSGYYTDTYGNFIHQTATQTNCWTIFNYEKTKQLQYFFETGALTVPGTITATAFNGNASSASQLATARTISLSGDASGSASFNGTANISIPVTVIDNSHNHTALSNITSLDFSTHSDDGASIKTTIDSSSTYLDFNLVDDGESDFFRWNFGRWDSATSSQQNVTLMTLTCAQTANSAKLVVNGTIKGNLDWNDITNKPSTFTPSDHTHSYLPLSGGTMTGRITLASTGIQTSNIAGYYTDQYGNFFHSRASTGDHWQFHSYDQSISLKYYADSGILNAPALATLNYGSGAPGSSTRGYGHAGAIYYQV